MKNIIPELQQLFHRHWVGFCKTKKSLVLFKKQEKLESSLLNPNKQKRILAEHLHFYIYTHNFLQENKEMSNSWSGFVLNKPCQSYFFLQWQSNRTCSGDITRFYFSKNSSTVPCEQFLKENREVHVQKIPLYIGKLYSESYSLSKW